MKLFSKKKVTIILAAILTAVISLGGTLAYLATTTNEETNVFTFDENIRAKLDEPNYNPDKAKNPQPGIAVRKDPQITNTSINGLAEFVAMRVIFENGAGAKLDDATTTRLLDLLEIDWSDSWATINTQENPKIFGYKYKLEPGQITEPIFNSVTIRGDISEADYSWLTGLVLNHNDSCYTFGAHNCISSLRHHADCATNTGGTCDCEPVVVHDPACTSLVGTLKGSCGHTPPVDSPVGFRITVKGAAVQTDIEGMNNWNAEATIDALLRLFS